MILDSCNNLSESSSCLRNARIKLHERPRNWFCLITSYRLTLSCTYGRTMRRHQTRKQVSVQFFQTRNIGTKSNNVRSNNQHIQVRVLTQKRCTNGSSTQRSRACGQCCDRLQRHTVHSTAECYTTREDARFIVEWTQE